MPNWIEGTMKVRGKAENLIEFFENAFDGKVRKSDYDSCTCYDIYEGQYINNSRRAFVNKDFECYICEQEEVQTVYFPIKQAWSFTPHEGAEERWINLSKEYGVDVRLQGFESGMRFYQDFAVVNGEIVIDEVKEYHENWEWDCPMPMLGG